MLCARRWTRTSTRTCRRLWARRRRSARCARRSEEHTSELQSRSDLVCRLLLEKKKKLNPGRIKRCARTLVYGLTNPEADGGPPREGLQQVGREHHAGPNSDVSSEPRTSPLLH